MPAFSPCARWVLLDGAQHRACYPDAAVSPWLLPTSVSTMPHPCCQPAGVPQGRLGLPQCQQGVSRVGAFAAPWAENVCSIMQQAASIR